MSPEGRRASEREASCWREGRRTWAPLLVPVLPAEVPFGLLGRILPTGKAIEGRLELHRLEPKAALELLDRAAVAAEAGLLAPDSHTGVERPELERTARTARDLARRVAHREQDLWRTGIAFASSTAGIGAAERLRAELRRGLIALGFRTRLPTYRAREALALPGGTPAARPPGYWHTLHSDGVAAFFPFGDEAVVDPDGILVGLLLDDAAPVILDRWCHASHSWAIFGTTGAGKSFTASLLATRSLWRDPELEIIVLDPLGEFAGWARALGGRVLAMGNDATVRLNPLDPVTTGGDRGEKAVRVAALIRTLFPSLSDEEAALLDSAVHRLYAEGPEVPTFGDLARSFDPAEGASGRLPRFLEVLTRGSLSRLDGPTNVVLDGSPLVITLNGVPEEHLPFHLSYLLDAVHGRIRAGGRRRLLVVDEAHLLARHPIVSEYLDSLARTARHFEAGLLLVSQHPEDFLRHDAGRSVLRNLRATLLLRITSLSAEARDFFQLTPAEAGWLPRARLPKEAGYAEGLLRLGPAHLPIAIVASTPEHELLVRALATGSGAPRGDGAPRTASLSEPARRENRDGRGAGSARAPAPRSP